MTRINVVSVKELSDQWLLAEYRELPRVILQQHIYIGDAPEKYCLGKGHVKWAILHANYCLYRYYQICEEMKYRGFTVNYDYNALDKYANDNQIRLYSKIYIPDKEDIKLNRQRLIEKYSQKPEFYRWTNRKKPTYLNAPKLTQN